MRVEPAYELPTGGYLHIACVSTVMLDMVLALTDWQTPTEPKVPRGMPTEEAMQQEYRVTQLSNLSTNEQEAALKLWTTGWLLAEEGIPLWQVLAVELDNQPDRYAHRRELSPLAEGYIAWNRIAHALRAG